MASAVIMINGIARYRYPSVAEARIALKRLRQAFKASGKKPRCIYNSKDQLTRLWVDERLYEVMPEWRYKKRVYGDHKLGEYEWATRIPK